MINFSKLLKCFFAVLYLLFMVNAYADNMQLLNGEDRAVFDVQVYEELKAQNGDRSDVGFQRADGVYIDYGENEYEYLEILNKKQVYMVVRHYYKPSGHLKDENTSFQGISIGSSRYYDEGGNLVREVVHTSDDWLDNLLLLARGRFDVDLWDRRSGQIYMGQYQGELIIQLFHLNGAELKLRGGNPHLKFAFLRYSDLEVLVIGDRNFIPFPNDGWGTGLGRAEYIVNGQEIFLD